MKTFTMPLLLLLAISCSKDEKKPSPAVSPKAELPAKPEAKPEAKPTSKTFTLEKFGLTIVGPSCAEATDPDLDGQGFSPVTPDCRTIPMTGVMVEPADTSSFPTWERVTGYIESMGSTIDKKERGDNTWTVVYSEDDSVGVIMRVLVGDKPYTCSAGFAQAEHIDQIIAACNSIAAK